MRQEQMTVIKQKALATNIFEMTLAGELVSLMGTPGQFVHIRVSGGFEPLLRRPISISSINKDKGEFTIIYRAEGKGTSILSTKTPGDVVDVLGPLGNGFPVNIEGEKVFLIGGGIGVPPLYELSKQLREVGVEPIHILGFQSSDVMFYEEEFNALGETYIATVDGTAGEKGFVTHIIDQLPKEISHYYACGPMPMLKAVSSKLAGIEGFLSFEERMGCGIGACFACVCKTNNQVDGRDYVKVCSDGPVFKAGVVEL
ncbi:dihydroorotate dehydrogenase electron transfer subunit [Chungangia koreensis]|uniref:Dihydroorotate dehydrogenase B (NAD(+)), electron transfer subunit n=1 Tax=Chungangia koreensis TaxID=752657 RepID=A0ABV8X2D4_9LACT